MENFPIDVCKNNLFYKFWLIHFTISGFRSDAKELTDIRGHELFLTNQQIYFKSDNIQSFLSSGNL